MLQRQRTSFIDIAKGILILVVIFHHIMFAANEVKVSGDFSLNLYLLPLYASWFMPAFFVITGYCSNFNKDFSVFIINNMRTLLWPAITFFLMTTIYGLILFPDITSIGDTLATIPIRGFNWFLMAMFISKMLYWFINRCVQNNVLKGIFVVMIAVAAIFFNDINFLNGNWFHHRHALYLTLFLYIGQVSREKKLFLPKYLMYATILFIVVVLTCMKLNGITPGIAGLWINFNVCQIPLHVILALTGTAMVLYMSMLISKCKLLEQIGKDSLIYYIFHIDIIRTVLPVICGFVFTPVGVLPVLLIDSVTVVVVAVICSMITYIFTNSKLMQLIKL